MIEVVLDRKRGPSGDGKENVRTTPFKADSYLRRKRNNLEGVRKDFKPKQRESSYEAESMMIAD